MSFALLETRLISRLHQKVRNGEWTVRALAKQSGISQPHLHNALKGHRHLSPENADRLMRAAGLTVFDLIDRAEFERYLGRPDLDPEWTYFRRPPTLP